MSDYKVASRYAKSLLDLAIELKKVDRIYDDMHLITQVYLQNPMLIRVLKNPIIRYDYKQRVLLRIFEKHIDPSTAAFLRLMCRKNRADILPETGQVFVEQYQEKKGIVKAKVSTAVQLSNQLTREFESVISKATGKKVDMETIVDAKLIGGYILRVGDYQIDDSLKSKLNNLGRQLKRRP